MINHFQVVFQNRPLTSVISLRYRNNAGNIPLPGTYQVNYYRLNNSVAFASATVANGKLSVNTGLSQFTVSLPQANMAGLDGYGSAEIIRVDQGNKVIATWDVRFVREGTAVSADLKDSFTIYDADMLLVFEQAAIGAQPAILVQNEGIDLSAAGAFDFLDFVGAGVTATYGAGGVTITIPGGGGGGITDGDKGGITVSGGGAVWTVDAGSITKAMMVPIPTATLMGRDTAGTGTPEDLTATEARALLAYTATLVPSTAVGGIVATNVQAALAELDTEKLATAGGTISGSLTVTGNFVVNGTTFTINSTTATYDDIIMTLGGDTAPVANDAKDRGVEYRWHNGTVAKVGFFGVDRSTGEFVYIPDAVNTAEVMSGAVGTIRANLNGNATTATGLAAIPANTFIANPAATTATPTAITVDDVLAALNIHGRNEGSIFLAM